MEDVVNSFNNFFVNVGPDLGKQIHDPGASGETPENVLETNPYHYYDIIMKRVSVSSSPVIFQCTMECV